MLEAGSAVTGINRVKAQESRENEVVGESSRGPVWIRDLCNWTSSVDGTKLFREAKEKRMKHQVWKAGLLMAVVAAIAGSTVFAAAGTPAPAAGQTPAAVTPAPAPAPPAHTELFLPELWKAFHNPTPWLNMGLDFRFRTEYGENWQTLDDDALGHEHEYQRYRARWWTKWVLGDDINLNTRLTWEFRTWDEPRAQDVNFNADEALFDWFNINLRNVGGMPLTATVGRQDIIMGGGWLVLDGTPLDGSRTIYFDAARATYDWADTSSKIDLIYISQSAESDRWLQPICDEDRAVTEQDENGVILWWTNTSFKPMQLEGFFIYKNDNPFDQAVTNIPSVWSRKAEIFTFGGAVSGTQGDHWKYRAEGAIQTGEKSLPTGDLSTGDMVDLEAYGALATLEYLFKDAHQNATHVTYEYASGDDPDSSDNEQFDLLWGEWPRWSELLIYTAAFETTPAELTNLHRINIGHRFNLNKQWTITADYHALWADEVGQASLANRYALSGEHDFRGDLFTAWAKFKFSEQLYGHLLGEYFIPGGYFQNRTDDDAFFLRVNVEYTF